MSEPVDYNELLSMDASEAVKPPPLPVGNYRVLVREQELTKSARKGTPGVKFTLSNFDPTADVDVDKWQDYCSNPAVDAETLVRNHTFWLTKAAMWRLKEFCQKAGAPDGQIGKMVSDCIGNTVIATLGQTVSPDGNVYDDITGIAADE